MGLAFDGLKLPARAIRKVRAPPRVGQYLLAGLRERGDLDPASNSERPGHAAQHDPCHRNRALARAAQAAACFRAAVTSVRTRLDRVAPLPVQYAIRARSSSS